MRLEAVAQIFNSLPDKISVSGIGIAAQALKIEIKVVGIHVDVNQRTIQIGKKIAVHPNDNTATIYLQADDLIRLIKEYGNEVEMTEL